MAEIKEDKIWQDLAKVKAEIKPVKKDGDNPFFKSKYATLSAVLEATKEPLAKHKVLLNQWPTKEGLATRFIAEDGSFIEGLVPFVNIPDMQKLGAAITYARRYAIVSMLNLEAEDNDGNDTYAAQPPEKFGSVTPNQIAEMVSLKLDLDRAARYFKIESWLQLSTEQAAQLILLKKDSDSKKEAK